ncbi:MAG: flagella basal body P-ring formation protein FlgA [Geminicoccaceae bacterium]|nr:MAG: flagella basal body P-ring formation protein FlgA [Geminicoccaceae bacterium]
MRRLFAACFVALTMISPLRAGEVVLAAGQPLDQLGVERLLAERLAAAMAADAVRIAVQRPILPLGNPYGSEARLRLEGVNVLPRDRFTARIAIVTPASNLPLTLVLEGEATPLRAIPVPRMPLGVGSTIADADLDWLLQPESRLRSEWVRDAGDLVGQEVRRALLAGRPIAAHAIGQPYLVRRGDNVTLVYRRGALTLELAAAAQGDGALGDQVMVRNSQTGAVVEARVLAPRTLLLEIDR